MPVGVLVHNLTISAFSNSKYSRAAGTFSQIIQKKEKNIFLKISSGKIIMLNEQNCATFGRVSNLKHNLIVTGKAGRNRNLGIRPTVRGVAMNPVDHPHGGRTKGGRPSVSP
jgi:large subunit ribosomal protein L2